MLKHYIKHVADTVSTVFAFIIVAGFAAVFLWQQLGAGLGN